MSFETTEGIASAMMQLVNDHGGASALMQQFQSGGMGDVASSWMNGTNHPVNPDQLGSTLNPQTVASVAQQHGVSSQDLLQTASQYLPQLIGHMSSTGQDQAPSGVMGTLLHLFQH